MSHGKTTRAFFLFALAAGPLALLLGSSLIPTSVGQAGVQQKPPPESRLDHLVRKYESVSLDPGRAAERVRRSGRLTIEGSATSFEVELVPHDLRAAGYYAEHTMAGGHRVGVEAGEVRTYKGRVRGMEGGEARFTVSDDKLEGVVITPGDNYYLQPLRDFDGGAGASKFVLYKGSDVREGAVGDCALTLEGKVEQGAEQFAAISPSAPSAGALAAMVLKETELATEADFEYVQALGGAEAANSEILGILNQVEGVYGAELGLTLRVVYQHSWSANDDPYVSTDSSAMLTEFRGHWNSNFGNVARDTAHMWTGKDVDGSTIGIAFLGTVCRSPRSGYGVSQRLTGTVGKVALSAHEIGHNFNAEHVTGCPNTIMYPNLGSSTQLTFCQTSRDQINSFVSANGICLTDVTATPTPPPTPAPAATPAVQFFATNLTASEAAGALLVEVRRTGDLSGPSAVKYATTDGTATDTSDYTAAYGTLTFGPGEASKTFMLLLTDDRYVEPAETLTISLSGAEGAGIGANQAATLTINSDDPADGPNPVRSATFDPGFFVRQHYVDFLNREPDAAGFAFWVGQTTGCGSTDLLVCRINVSAAFFLSIEFQETGYLAYRMHKAAYGNLPGASVPVRVQDFLLDSRRVGEGVEVGVGNWQQQLESNKQAYAAEFVNRARFTSLYSPATNAQFVDQLNANAGGALSPAERDALVAALNGGAMTRGQALRAMAEDADFAAAEKSRAFVMMQYMGYLRRDPDEGGYQFWLSKLNEFNGNYVQAELVRAFITSGEYEARFAP